MTLEIRTLADDELITEFVAYDPDTGALTWKPRDTRHFTSGFRSQEHNAAIWSSKHSGKPAFNKLTAKGYLRGSLGAKHYMAHRVIWLLMTGAWPAEEIDHVNGDRADNRWANLRAATRSENCKNRVANKASTSALKGVSWSSHMRAWRSQIASDGRTTHLGYFGTQEEAAEAYDAAAIRSHGAYAKTNFSESV